MTWRLYLMPSFGQQKPDPNGFMIERKRWEKILSLPPDTPMYSIATGKNYKVRQFTPIFRDAINVDWFGVDKSINGFDEQVYVPHLRLFGDYEKCSLNAKKDFK